MWELPTIRIGRYFWNYCSVTSRRQGVQVSVVYLDLLW